MLSYIKLFHASIVFLDCFAAHSRMGCSASRTTLSLRFRSPRCNSIAVKTLSDPTTPAFSMMSCADWFGISDSRAFFSGPPPRVPTPVSALNSSVIFLIESAIGPLGVAIVSTTLGTPSRVDNEFSAGAPRCLAAGASMSSISR